MFRENVITELFSNKRNIVKLIIDLGTVFTGIFLGLLVRFEGKWEEHVESSYFIVYGIAFLCFYLIRKNSMKSWSYTNSLDVLNLTATNFVALIVTLAYYAVSRQ
ncbi:hypothetical protein [Cetobacterium sp.]|uniref:hypothetical protein n=1 Tax=Cetobacterium sp. TaxID=2071632 RepID=UPI003AF1DC81